MAIKELQNVREFNDTLSNNNRVVVNFSSPFSRAASLIEPTVEELAKSYPQITFVKVDIEQFEQIGAEHDVVAFPTFVFFKDGVRQEPSVVGANKMELEEKVKSLA
ncbi:thioredoxin family protein [Streptomyces flaveolus]|uniref:thioredoxin family protein n=1 Tax=Streptomyces flaveolus TaxID=67297 RepID=UPI0033A44101